MSIKFALAPIPFLLGGWMFASSFSTTEVQQSVTPYSTEQQVTLVEMPEPAKSFLRYGGAAIAVVAPSGFVFWGLQDVRRRKEKRIQRPVAYLAPANINTREREVVDRVPVQREEVEVPLQEQKKQANTTEIPNFYMNNGRFESWEEKDSNIVSEFKPHNGSQDKYAEVSSLVYENTVGIVGKEKGSGKTSKLGYLIAEHIKLGHLVWMVNPFAKGQHWKGIKVFGRGYNFVEATSAIREFTRIAFWRIAEAGDEMKDYEPFDDYHLHLSLDEMSNYSSEVDTIDVSVMPKFWEAVVQFLRQANMSVSFASHGDTQAMLGGAKALAGKSETIKDAIVWLYAQAVTDKNVEGNKRCAGWAYLIRPDGGERQKLRVEIPRWMQGPPATRLDGKDKYNYIQLVQKYCPQFLYVPPSAQSCGEDARSSEMDAEQFRQKLIEQEDIWGWDEGGNG